MPLEERIVHDMADPEHFNACLGKQEHYHNFLLFWQEEMEKKGWENVLNEYIFKGGARADDLLMRMLGSAPP